MDGIDAVLVDLADSTPAIIAADTFEWPPALREQLQAAARGTFLTAEQFARLDAETGIAFAEAAKRIITGHRHDQIVAIGSHGQTLAHAPQASPGYSLQLGCPARIVEGTGITTVADFRRRDIAAGGQGAPLVPAFHEGIFRSKDETRVILNIGGIANITCLPAAPGSDVTGFDTGPGNCLMDSWVQQQLGQPFDQNGAFAAQGNTNDKLLKQLLEDPYFATPPPKSTGTDYFSGQWLRQQLGSTTGPAQDIQATLLQLCASSISQAIKDFCRPAPDRVLVCGGGAHNPPLMKALDDLLPCPVEDTEVHGMSPDWVEATAFAWLAKQTLENKPGNLPSVTGARGPRVLGAIYPS